MTRILFVSNGHGEAAIADRIAAELHALAPAIESDHVALVGDVRSQFARAVGPRKEMPSGGLIAMGNVANLLRDLRAGLFGLSLSHWRFLRTARDYAAVVAVGDAFALWMALRVRAPVVYVGTAKSIYVAPYGRGEERLMRRARAVFVRDEATAARLRAHGVAAQAPGNAIVDLFAEERDPAFAGAASGFESIVALLPGSRAHAYDDAVFLVDVFADVARDLPMLGAVLSIAPGIEWTRMARTLRAAGRVVSRTPLPAVPFEVLEGERAILRAWSGDIGPLLHRSSLVLGQAGTANEAAAAAGLPIFAFDRGIGRKHAWYRRRQERLLGEALIVLREDRGAAVAEVRAMLEDPQRRARLGESGRERMGPPGGSRRIAERVAAIASGAR
ncbi:MAG TPA: hypothetical protein VIN40_04985 [Candidatus Tyrphobacter sp.]